MSTTTYSVKVVTDKEFQRLAKSDPRYSFVDEDNLGFADPQKGVGYVRNTAWPALNRFLVEHEFEHLLNPENGVDEDDNGIHHKKFFKDVVTRALPFAAAFVPPPFNIPAAAGLQAAGGAIRGERGLGKQALMAGGLAGAGNFLTQGSVMGIPKAGSVIPQTTRPSSIPSVSGASQAPGVLTRAMGGQSLVQGLTSKLKAFNLFGGGGPPGGGGGGPGTPPTFPTTGSGTGRGGFDLGRFGAGAALSLTPELFGFGKSPEMPDLGQLPSLQSIRSQAGQPLSDVAKSATTRLQERLAQTGQSALETPEMQTITNDIRTQFGRAKEQLYSQYQLNSPGTDIANNTSFQRAMAELERQEGAAIANVRQTELGRFENRQTGDITTALGIDTQTLNTLMELAQADIATIMARTGMAAQEAQDFRSTFAQLGTILASSGQGAFSPFAMMGLGR